MYQQFLIGLVSYCFFFFSLFYKSEWAIKEWVKQMGSDDICIYHQHKYKQELDNWNLTMTALTEKKQSWWDVLENGRRRERKWEKESEGEKEVDDIKFLWGHFLISSMTSLSRKELWLVSPFLLVNNRRYITVCVCMCVCVCVCVCVRVRVCVCVCVQLLYSVQVHGCVYVQRE